MIRSTNGDIDTSTPFSHQILFDEARSTITRTVRLKWIYIEMSMDYYNCRSDLSFIHDINGKHNWEQLSWNENLKIK